MTRTRYWWHKDAKKFLTYPPDDGRKIFGQAPMYLSDVMPAERHPGTGEIVESRSKWKAIDKKNGWITTGKDEQINPRKRPSLADKEREIRDITARVINDLDNNQAPISDNMRAACKIKDKVISDRLGFDAANALGRKKK